MNNAIYEFSFNAKCALELALRTERYHINTVCDLNWDDCSQRVIGYHDWTDSYQDRFGPGVYAMFDYEDTVLYVGKSKNLERRLTEWFEGIGACEIAAWYPSPSFVMTVTVENEWTAARLEKLLIPRLNPLYNNRLRKTEEELRLERVEASEGVQWRDGKMYTWETMSD
jgi:predicted GIY-YIG superfamily endonuclease